MPHVVNGIGTWYYGKRNRTTRRGSCGSCGRFGELLSYDTTLFFTFVFIPLIPLKRVHVLDQCPACKRHRVAKLGKWEQIRDASLEEAIVAVNQRPTDPRAAIVAIATSREFHDDRTFLGLVDLVGPRFPADADVWNAIADGHAFFGRHAESADALRTSLAIRDDRDVRRVLGARLALSGQPQLAHEYIEPILKSADAEHHGAVLLLVESYQAVGDHEQAGQLLDEYESVFPTRARSKDVKQYRRNARKYGSSGRPIKSTLVGGVSGQRKPAKPDGGWRSRAPLIIAPVLLLAAVVGFAGWSMYLSSHRLVYAVGGIRTPYQVQIGGRTVTVSTNGATGLRVPEGEILVHVTAPGSHIPDGKFKLTGSFFERPFDSTVYIVNPDQLAVIEWDEIEYVPQGSNRKPVNNSRVEFGTTFRKFQSVDYPFVEPPQSIQMDANASNVRKTALSVLPAHQPQRTLAAVARAGNVAALKEFVQRGLSNDPDCSEYLNVAAALLEPQVCIDLIRPSLETRPLRIESHRVYQELAERAGRTDLSDEYRKLLQADPANPALSYLLGRTLADRAEARRLHHGAAKDPVAGRYAAGALAYDELSQGHFREALQVLDAAPPGKINQPMLDRHRLDALEGLDKLEDCLQSGALAGQFAELDSDTGLRKLLIELRAHGKPAAETMLDTGLSAWQDPSAPLAVRKFQRYYLAMIAYAGGDDKPLGALSGDELDQHLEVLIARGALKEAAAAMDADPARDKLTERLTIWLAAHLAGETALADEQLAKSVTDLESRGAQPRRIAAWLRPGATAPTSEEVADFPMYLPEKRLLLAAIAARHPERRSDCLSLLKTLNFDHRPPWILLERTLQNSGGPAGK